jgi:hypothetical protein
MDTIGIVFHGFRNSFLAQGVEERRESFMYKKVATVGFWLGVLAGLAAGATAWGKPADLPTNNQIECSDGADDPPVQRKFALELEFTPQGITVKVGLADDDPAPAPAIDPVLPAFIEQWLQHLGDLLTQPERAISLDALRNKLPRLDASEKAPQVPSSEPQPRAGQTDKDTDMRALQMFIVAEVCRQAGRYEAARYYYQRVHLLAPTSRVGQLAIERLQQVEERLRDDAEEAAPAEGSDPPQSMNREPHKGLMPLGLVRVWF